jgi:predicted Fe-Mo cluster-binding NifX family protein
VKIAISSTGDGIDAQVDSRFGRCSYFIIYDTETEKTESIKNEGLGAMGGAGILSAQTMINKGVEILITGNVGPNAFYTLTSGGVKIYGGATGTLKEVIDKYKKGELSELSGSSVPPHFGVNR